MKKEIQDTIEKAFQVGLKARGQGKVATYIPELAKVDPNLLGISITTIDGDKYLIGETNQYFTMQSTTKVYVLAHVLKTMGMELFNDINYEPSGNPFSSMVRLEDEKGRPRNPYINSGAILTCTRLPGKTSDEKISNMRNFLKSICPRGSFEVDESVYQSESATGFKNRAMANVLKGYNLIDDVDVAIETYFKLCSLKVTLEELSDISLFLANDGIDPFSKKRIISDICARTVVSLMSTCGMYDEVGEVAIKIGLPCKSSVSGAITAIAPHKMVVSVFSPPLGEKGNSHAGLEMLEFISNELSLSIYT